MTSSNSPSETNPMLQPTPPAQLSTTNWPSVVLAIAAMAFVALFTWKGWPVPASIAGAMGIFVQSVFVHAERNA